METTAARQGATQKPYTGFERMPIIGEWRSGRSKVLQDRNPYTGEIIREIPWADAVTRRSCAMSDHQNGSASGQVFR
jgi:hypothetical protein